MSDAGDDDALPFLLVDQWRTGFSADGMVALIIRDRDGAEHRFALDPATAGQMSECLAIAAGKAG
ncbi:hypothetical protein [Brevundimonas sp.]|uniref:hypothetical protein n=1 Tax=Brevundimonas sp. TaxID=1871086 RepID=UPI002D3CA97E|nr:hypothetical protein [Brevundimonas sp.]HYD26946.1 hypothetical protein [Brevundimonas sp.]